MIGGGEATRLPILPKPTALVGGLSSPSTLAADSREEFVHRHGRRNVEALIENPAHLVGALDDAFPALVCSRGGL
jgi:hypothetical protein